MRSPLVLKFGGTSVGDSSRILHCAKIIQIKVRKKIPLCVVVSAPAHATDDLLGLAQDVCNPKDPAKLDPRSLDALLASGEQVGASLLALALAKLGIPVYAMFAYQAGILASGNYGSASPSKVTELAKIRKALREGKVVVVTGYQAIHQDTGDLVTLGRGGSNLTAIFLAAKLKSPMVEIYTDTPGILTADPILASEAKTIPTIFPRDAALLAKSGVRVLEPKSLELARKYGLKLKVLSSLDPRAGETLILPS